MQLINKENIAIAFGRAVNTYDQVADLQRYVADQLIGRILKNQSDGKILDAGCGTGYVSLQLKNQGDYEITALDLSSSMLAKAQRQQAADHYVEGDIENLPLLSDQFDVVVSSLAVQWCHSFQLALSELMRVLKPSGKLYLTTLIQPTLYELSEAWSGIDAEQHVIHFLAESDCQHALDKIADEIHIQFIEMKSYAKVLKFDNIVSLLKSLQGIGATALPARQKGLMGKSKFKALEKAYPKLANDEKFGLTYQVLEIVIVKA